MIPGGGAGMRGGKTPVTDALVEFVAGLGPQALPRAVVEAASGCLMDWLGTAVRGATEPLARALQSVVGAAGGAAQASVVGSGLRTSAAQAALVNGAQAHALDFDDTHIPSLVHGSAPVAPVVLALGEWLHASGAQALAAFVAGFEVETRIGRAMGRRLAERGWHVTAVLGHFGAAAAAGKLLGLDAARLSSALGIAGTQAAGLEGAFGTMCKPLHPGKAAADGLLAALLAREGFTGPAGILEGEGSLPATFVGPVDLRPALDGLGSRFAVLENSVKPYAACLLTHASIDAARAIRQRWAPAADAIESVECRVFPLAVKVAANPAPRTGLEGKFSLAFCTSLALVRGEAGEAEFTDAAVHDPALSAVVRRVRVEADPAVGEVEARVTVRLTDGRVLGEHVPAARGTPANPLGAAELQAKFRRLAGTVLPEEAIARLIDALRRLPELPDVGTLAAGATPGR